MRQSPGHCHIPRYAYALRMRRTVKINGNLNWGKSETRQQSGTSLRRRNYRVNNRVLVYISVGRRDLFHLEHFPWTRIDLTGHAFCAAQLPPSGTF